MSIHKFPERRLYICAGSKETWTAGVPAAEAVDSMIRQNKGNAPFVWEVEQQDDLDEAGGKEEVTEIYDVSKRVTGSIAQDRARPHTIAALLAFHLGKVTSSLVGVATAYEHKIEPQPYTTDAFVLPTMTVEDMYYATLGYKYVGMMVNSVGLSYSRKGFLNISADLIGCGRRTKLTSDSAAAAVSESPLLTGDVKIWDSTTTGWDGTVAQGESDLSGTPTELSTNIHSLDWKSDTNINADSQYQLSSGLYMGTSEREQRSQSLSLSVDLEDDTHLARLDAGTEIALSVDLKGGQIGTDAYYYGLNLIFPLLQYKGVTVGEEGGHQVCALNDIHVKQDATYGSVLAYVWNAQTAYAA